MKELSVEQARDYINKGYCVLITNPVYDDFVVESWKHGGEGMHPVDDTSGHEFMGFDELLPDDKLYLIG